jgi:hypothetical protein
MVRNTHVQFVEYAAHGLAPADVADRCVVSAFARQGSLFAGLGNLASNIAGGVANALAGSAGGQLPRMAQQHAQRMSSKEKKRREREVSCSLTRAAYASGGLAVPSVHYPTGRCFQACNAVLYGRIDLSDGTWHITLAGQKSAS